MYINGSAFVEMKHSLGHITIPPTSHNKVGDEVGQSLGLSKNWRDEINPHWADEFVSYDTQHWSALFMMLAITKTTRLIKYFGTRVSQCLFRLWRGTDGLTDRDRWIKYLSTERGWSQETIDNLPRSYWRRRCRYVRPPPMDIIKSLICTVEFFSLLIDPETGTNFFGPGWRRQFRTAISYVQKGYLSDPPNISMYTRVGVISERFGVY